MSRILTFVYDHPATCIDFLESSHLTSHMFWVRTYPTHMSWVKQYWSTMSYTLAQMMHWMIVLVMMASVIVSLGSWINFEAMSIWIIASRLLGYIDVITGFAHFAYDLRIYRLGPRTLPHHVLKLCDPRFQDRRRCHETRQASEIQSDQTPNISICLKLRTQCHSWALLFPFNWRRGYSLCHCDLFG